MLLLLIIIIIILLLKFHIELFEKKRAKKENQKTNPETNGETNPETNGETNPETNGETSNEMNIECDLNKTMIYYRNENGTYVEYKNDDYIYSSTDFPLSLHLKFRDKELNIINNINDADIKIYNAYMYGNNMNILNWTFTKSSDLSEIYLDLDDSKKNMLERLTTNLYNFTFCAKNKAGQEKTFVFKVNHLDTTTNPNTPLDLGNWTTATVANYKYSYANIKTQVGYYFSHDNNIYLLDGKGGFNPGQVTEIEIFDVFDNNTVIKRNEIVRSLINFGKATPENVYNTRKHNKTVSIDDFKYEIPIMYGSNPLINSEGDTLKVPVYIGRKGDANLDNEVNTGDSTTILTYYYNVMNSNIESTMLIPTDNNLGVSSPTDELDQFAAFLADVTENEYGPTNWKMSKKERTLNDADAQYILFFFSKKISSDKSDNEIWSEIIGPSRFGEQ